MIIVIKRWEFVGKRCGEETKEHQIAVIVTSDGGVQEKHELRKRDDERMLMDVVGGSRGGVGEELAVGWIWADAEKMMFCLWDFAERTLGRRGERRVSVNVHTYARPV